MFFFNCFKGFGMSHPVGHVDFFPNNGRNQPGCKTDKLKSFITDGLTEGNIFIFQHYDVE